MVCSVFPCRTASPRSSGVGGRGWSVVARYRLTSSRFSHMCCGNCFWGMSVRDTFSKLRIARSFGKDPGSSRNTGHHHDIWSEYGTLADCAARMARARSTRFSGEGLEVCSSIPARSWHCADKTVVADDGFQ